MATGSRLVSGLAVVPLAVSLALAAPATAKPSGATVAASRGRSAPYLPSDKIGFGTAKNTRSRVWYTLQPGGGAGEIYYPRLDTPAARAMTFVVVGPSGKAVRVGDVGTHSTALATPHSLRYRQIDTGPRGAWVLRTTYLVDPRTSALTVQVRLVSRTGTGYRLYVLYEPTLSATPSDDRGRTRDHALIAEDSKAASALRSSPHFVATSNGYRGRDDGWTDLHHDGRMNTHRPSTEPGNLVQTGRLPVTGLRAHRSATLTVGFGHAPDRASERSMRSSARGFAVQARAYDRGWQRYLARLRPPPASLRTATEKREYRVSQMVLAASEDKKNRGAFVASPSMPWAWGAQEPSGPYHLVWSRDLYEITTALIAEGDRRAANRALTFLFDKQQRKDGSFPQNSTVTGKPFWTGLQLDEVADPIVLAYQLRRDGVAAYQHVKRAANFIVGFRDGSNRAPWTEQERWENQDGYSPATIASEVAGLVCAAAIARRHGHDVEAHRWATTADRWQSKVKSWTATTNGPYSKHGYFLRLTKDGKPNTGTTYSIGDSGPANADQRTVVDPSFLELVRLGVLPANDRTVRNTIKVVDRKLSYRTSHGRYWHRASFDGYGETDKGRAWILGSKPGSGVTRGRGWPLLSGERGEYEIAAGQLASARHRLATMASSANAGGLLPEQVWDHHSPGGARGFKPGTPTLSATPLAWTHAQFIRLAVDLAHHAVTERPAAVAKRYSSG